MTTSAKCRPAAERIRSRFSRIGGSIPAIAWRAASSASAGARSISTSMFRRISRSAADSTRAATNSAAIESASGHPARTPISPTSTASDPAKSLPKCTAFDSSAALWNRRPVLSEISVRETSISEHDADHQERPPGCVHVNVDPAGQPRDRETGDADAHEGEHPGLEERRQMLGLAVAVLVLLVRRASRDSDREERQERGDEVGARVQRLRDEAERAARDAGAELEGEQRAGGRDRDERGSPLWAHPLKARATCCRGTSRRATLPAATRPHNRA